MSGHLLEARHLVRHFRQRGTRTVLRAVDGLDFSIDEGSTLGVVGESGSGKSTLARLVMALDRPTAGEVIFAGESLFDQPAHRLTRLRRGFQMVFQDPMAPSTRARPSGASSPSRSISIPRLRRAKPAAPG